MAIVTGISIDYNNEYKLNILVSDDKNTIYQIEGKTISEAFNKINNIIPKQLYLGHLDMVILSENACKKINNIIDFFYKDDEVSKIFHLIMSKNSPHKILKSISKLEPFPFEKISLDINSNNSLSDNITYTKYIETYLKKGIDPFIPIVDIYNKKYISTIGQALFKNNKLIGYTNKEEAQGINIILGNNNELVINNNSIKNIKVKKRYNKNTIYINIYGISKVNKKQINNSLKKILYKSINKIKKYNTDILGFGNMIYKNNPNYFYKHPNYLQELNIVININIKIKNNDSIKEFNNEKVE